MFTKQELVDLRTLLISHYYEWDTTPKWRKDGAGRALLDKINGLLGYEPFDYHDEDYYKVDTQEEDE